MDRLDQEVFTNRRKTIEQDCWAVSDDAMRGIRRDIIAAPCRQPLRRMAIHDEIDRAREDIANLLMRMAVERRGRIVPKGELYEHHTAAVAQDPTLGAFRRRHDRLVGGIREYFHGLLLVVY